MNRGARLLASAGLLIIQGSLEAADPPKGDKSATLYEEASQKGIFAFDYGPPASPALTLMGLSPDKINLSTALKPFVLSLPSLFSSEGGQTAGIDFAPLSLFRTPANQNYDRYAAPGNYGGRVFARTRVEIAGYNGVKNDDASKAKPSKVAFGISTTLTDSNDPLVVRLPGATADAPYFHQCLGFGQARLDAYEQTFADQAGTGAAQQLAEIHADYSLAMRDDDFLRKRGLDLLRRIAQVTGKPPGLGMEAPAPVITPDAWTVWSQLAMWAKEHAADPSANAVGALAASQLPGTSKPSGSEPRLSADTRKVFEDLRAWAKYKAPAGAALSYQALATQYAGPEASNPLPEPAGLSVAQIREAIRSRLTDLQKLNKDQRDAVKALSERGSAEYLIPKLLSDCAKGASVLAAVQPALSLGAGPIWRGTAGRPKNLRSAGQAFWIGGRVPLGRPKLPVMNVDEPAAYPALLANGPLSYWMAGGSVRYARHGYSTTGDKAQPEIRSDTIAAWAGVEHFAKTWRLAGQFGYTKDHALDRSLTDVEQTGWRWIGSGSVRLASDNSLWIGASYGKGNGNTDNQKDRTFKITLEFAPPDASAIFGNAVKK